MWMTASILAVAVTLTKPDSLRQASAWMENLQELGLGWFSPIIDSKIFYVFSGLFFGAGLLLLAQSIVKIWRNPSLISSQTSQARFHLAKIYFIHYRSQIGSIFLGVPIRYWFTAKEKSGNNIRTDDQRIRVRSGHSRYIPTNTTLQPELEDYEECTDWEIHIAARCASYALEISLDGRPIEVRKIDDTGEYWGESPSHYDLFLSYYMVQLSHPSAYYDGVKVTPHYCSP